MKTIIPQNELRNLFEWESQNTESNFHLEAGSVVNFTLALINPPKLSRKINFYLAKGAQINLYGIFLNKKDSSSDVRVNIFHEGESSCSNVKVKGIVEDQAHNSFYGRISIGKNAHLANARLEQRVLLLSKEAKAEGEPILEIKTNDVQASHAAAIGRIDEEQLFYLLSRGIDSKKARTMIVKGFFDDIMQVIPESEQKQDLAKLLK